MTYILKMSIYIKKDLQESLILLKYMNCEYSNSSMNYYIETPILGVKSI